MRNQELLLPKNFFFWDEFGHSRIPELGKGSGAAWNVGCGGKSGFSMSVRGGNRSLGDLELCRGNALGKSGSAFPWKREEEEELSVVLEKVSPCFLGFGFFVFWE